MAGLALALGQPDELLTNLWKMIAYACRYGHQPILAQLGALTMERLCAFNDGVQHWLDAERKTGSTAQSVGYLAEGGG